MSMPNYTRGTAPDVVHDTKESAVEFRSTLN